MSLPRLAVTMINGVEYQKIDDEGQKILVEGKPQVLAVVTVIV